jgi:hypothetical protein
LKSVNKDLVAQIISNERLWEMTGQINVNKEKRQANLAGLDTHSVRMIVNFARQLCSGTHKVQEEGVGQEIHGAELH